MNEAPERIWAATNPSTVYMDGSSPLTTRDRPFRRAVEYIRADLVPDPSLVVVRRERVAIWAAEWDDLITSVIRKWGPRDRYVHDHNCIAEMRRIAGTAGESESRKHIVAGDDHNCIAEMRALIAQPAEGGEDE